MTSDKKLRLSFADFDCEITGYDDPFDMLRRLVELYAEIAGEGHGSGLSGGPSSAELRARFQAKLVESAASLGVAARVQGDRVVISCAEAGAAPACAGVAPAALAGMAPGLLAEFEAMRARFTDAETGAAVNVDAPPKSSAISGGGKPDTPLSRPRARVVRGANAASPEPAPRATGQDDNFLFADFAAPESPPLLLSKSQLVKPPRPPEPEGGGASASAREIREALRRDRGGFGRLREVAEAGSPRLDPSPKGARWRMGGPD
ncbi:MAG: hypothetical protein WD969_10095 [Paracoccaceae bacterium]